MQMTAFALILAAGAGAILWMYGFTGLLLAIIVVQLQVIIWKMK